MKAYLSLGSNIGDKNRNIQEAIRLLAKAPGITVTAVSSFYETEPWGKTGQESFYNLAVELETILDPFSLLKTCQEIEDSLGRKRAEHWGPRIIDLDILIYDELNLQTEKLIIPHPYLEIREFVLAPLREIAKDLILPSGRAVREIKGEGKVKKLFLNSAF